MNIIKADIGYNLWVQHHLAKRFLSISLSTIALSLLCVMYMLASPASLQIKPLDSAQAAMVPVASQPDRMAFVAFSADSRIKAFWKQPEGSTYHFTIEIDPLDSATEAETELDEAGVDSQPDYGTDAEQESQSDSTDSV